jgi:hypothetical protein
VEIWKKNMANVDRRLKGSLKKCRMKMRSLKVAQHG